MASKRVRSAIISPIAVVAISWGAGAQTPLTLPEAIRMSESYSQSVSALRHDSLSAEYDLAAAQALRFPTITGSAVTYYTNVVQKIEIPFNSIEMGSKDNYLADLKVTLPLYTGGKISNQVRMQSSLTESRGYNLAAGRLGNAYQTRRAYLGLMLAQSVAAAAEASLKRIELVNRDVENLYRSGMADSVDILNSELALQKAKLLHNERLTSVDNAAAALSRLIGKVPGDFVIQEDNLPVPDFEVYENIETIPDRISRPELKTLESRIDAARYSVGLNKAGYLPSLSAYGGYTVGKPNRDPVGDTWNDYWTAGLNLNWEFNLGGRAFHAASAARENARSAEAARDDLTATLKMNAEISFHNLSQAFRNYGISQREYEIANRQYALGREQQKAGRLSINRLLELEADLTASEQTYHSATISYFLSETDYLYATGSEKIYGGF